MMSNPQLRYFEQGDILHLMIAKGKEMKSVAINPHVALELNEEGNVIGMEILDAKRFIRDFVL